MASTIEDIEALIQEAITTGFRGRLLERGLARSMIWDDGELPDGSPNFSGRLSYDLLSYGYSLLSLAIRLRELNGDETLCRVAFEKSAIAITDVIQNGIPNDPERGFHRVIAAAAYHLGRFSAKAYSLIQPGLDNGNLSRIERVLSLLMVRQLDDLEETIMEWKASGVGSDDVLAAQIENELQSLNSVDTTEIGSEDLGISSIEIPVLDLALSDNYYSAIFEFLFALESGDPNLLVRSISQLDDCLSVTIELNMVSQWWIFRITKHLINDLWESSFHELIPVDPDSENEHYGEWENLRQLFIVSLFKRSKAEIELWPSQIEGARRAVNDSDDLVVSLPTSAGKTRIAELCILRCLAMGKRVLFITPLRALSAQTETSLRRTFLPLGKSVSSLYGSIGTSDFEQDVLRSEDIIVGTPEKLDFALRNDPTLIDDVGLVVLDEGHMIGLNEREINYEVQIQRLLKRDDSNQRRIVCLSAILPDGEQFEDFVSWLRKDKQGEAIQSDWRPTDLRFGEITWRSNSGWIYFTIGENQPFIPRYVLPSVPSLPNPGVRRTQFPKDTQELTLATAWRLIQDDHTVLIYCPRRKSVDAFAKTIVDLHKRGALNSVLESEKDLELANTLGNEWLGEEHPIVQCMNIGVAIHHGALPTPFRKEMEELLRKGILKVTVSSPTLAQGLNLGATAVIVYSLYRNREKIDSSEFKNVVGRAGRAFVDTHGLVLHPIFDDHDKRQREWQELINDTTARNMESGLVLLVNSLLLRMAASLGSASIDLVLEYVMNNVFVWECPDVENEPDEQREQERAIWNNHLIHLDTALLSLLGNEDISMTEISSALEEILGSSLWQRRLNRRGEELRELFDTVLTQRGIYIWNETTSLQRKGYFLAGVGLATGRQLDDISQQANLLLVNANEFIQNGDQSSAIDAITALAELVFTIPPFIPRVLPDNWRDILVVWLEGKRLTEGDYTNLDDALGFIEDGLIYRLPWGLEAIRVRAQANEDMLSDSDTIDNHELSLVVPAIENGTLNISAALLMQAGFNSRQAAIEAVVSTNASFTNRRQFRRWLESDIVNELTHSLVWPSPETAKLWRSFWENHQLVREITWASFNVRTEVEWISGHEPVTSEIVKLWNWEEGNTQVIASNGEHVGNLAYRYDLLESGIYKAVVDETTSFITITYWGADNEPFELVTD